MKNLAAIVLAAGKGTRMKSALPKVLHEVAGVPMITHVVSLLKALGLGKIIVVVGHGAPMVRDCLQGLDITFVEQKEQLGTGHAVLTAVEALEGFTGDILILSGDVPLLTRPTVRGLLRIYRKAGPGRAMALITAVLDHPTGYGRIIRDESRKILRIVEEKDARPGEKAIREVNTGCYLIDSAFLKGNIGRIGASNAQGEYYLPDLVRLAVEAGRKVAALTLFDPTEVMGINNRVELAAATRVMSKRILRHLMMSGVTIIDPDRTVIGADVRIGRDTIIHPGVSITASAIGRGSVIEQGAIITGSRIGTSVTIRAYSIIEESSIGKKAVIGPFARLRPGNRLAEDVRIGNFVEIKKSRLARGVKAGHLSYLGDSVIGAGVNIGAGTITCNYDGKKKFTTRIGAGAFIGSDTQLVAPVSVGRGAYVGSGTTVTRDVPPGALVTSRATEKVIKGWVRRRFGK